MHYQSGFPCVLSLIVCALDFDPGPPLGSMSCYVGLGGVAEQVTRRCGHRFEFTSGRLVQVAEKKKAFVRITAFRSGSVKDLVL